MGGSMKVHQFPRGIWENDQSISLTLGCKRLRPLAPKITISDTVNTSAAFDLKSFIRPESAPIKLVASDINNKDSSPQVETHPRGTRWNPTQEQISISLLEMLYKNGMDVVKALLKNRIGVIIKEALDVNAAVAAHHHPVSTRQ